jgi:hypothetical protein
MNEQWPVWDPRFRVDESPIEVDHTGAHELIVRFPAGASIAGSSRWFRTNTLKVSWSPFQPPNYCLSARLPDVMLFCRLRSPVDRHEWAHDSFELHGSFWAARDYLVKYTLTCSQNQIRSARCKNVGVAKQALVGQCTASRPRTPALIKSDSRVPVLTSHNNDCNLSCTVSGADSRHLRSILVWIRRK